jgi:2-methylcitrate dehydratase PrpD
MDVINDLARFIIETDYKGIPADVIDFDKDVILDTLGALLAGSSAPACKEVVDFVWEMGGRQESSILVYGGKVPALTATLANATMAQARDFGDVHDKAVIQSHCSLVPAALAAAEAVQASGKQLLAGVILGAEVACRIGVAIQKPLSFTRTGTLGYFGATAVAGKILGLSLEELLNAFGIVYSQVSTTMQPIVDGALVKRIHPGFAGQGALLSCNLARKGVTGAKGVLEGEYGYLTLYERGAYERERITDGLGQRYELKNLSVKPYPCAREMHGALDVAVELSREGQVEPKKIKQVAVTMPRQAFDLSGKPYAEISGHESVEAILNGAYCTAVALVYGRVEIGNFTPEAVKDPDVVAVAKKTQVILDPKLPEKGLVPMTLRVTMEDGSTIERIAEDLKGSPTNALSAEELEEKFQTCAKYAAVPLKQKRLTRIIEEIKHLDERPDVENLVSLMIPR